MSIYLLTLIAIALAMGSVAKSVVGIGLPLCAMPVLSLFLGVPHAAAIVALPIAFTNAWQVWQFRSQWSSVQFLRTFLFLGGVGTVIGTYALARVPSELLSLTLGVVVVVYLAMRAARPALRLDMRFGRQIAPAVGLVAGTFMAQSESRPPSASPTCTRCR